MMKTCTKCKSEKSVDAFYRSRNLPGGRTTICSTCWRRMPSQTNEARRVANGKIRANARRFISNHYASNPCVDCGESDPVVLELDHVRGEKVTNVSAMVAGCRSIKAIATEIAKCDVVCVNCHRKRTARSQGWYENDDVPPVTRAQKMRYKARQHVRSILLTSECADCGLTGREVLEFDHVRGDKIESVSVLVSSGAGVGRIQTEIDKCEVVCANCHRRRTVEAGF